MIGSSQYIYKCLIIFFFNFSRLVVADVAWYEDADSYNAGALGYSPNQTFKSTSLVAPIFQVNKFIREKIDKTSFLFFDWGLEKGKYGAAIFRSDDLSLVYIDPQYSSTCVVRVQQLGKETYLTFWEGIKSYTQGEGRCRMLDKEYKTVYKITPIGLNQSLADEHEFQVTEDGTVLISIYEAIPGIDLTSVGGPKDGLLSDQLFQEINPITGELLFSWRASENVRLLEDTFAEYDNPGFGGWADGFDPFHLNSVTKVRNYDNSRHRLIHHGSSNAEKI